MKSSQSRNQKRVGLLLSGLAAMGCGAGARAASENVLVLNGDPFLSPAVTVLTAFLVPDWSSSPGPVPGSVEVTAEKFTQGGGLSQPTRIVLGTAPAGATFVLVNQIAADITFFNFAGLPAAFEDLDGNGLADAWERQYFGQTGVDPSADADGDGRSNLEEFRAGTNPMDAQALRITMDFIPAGDAGEPALIQFDLPSDAAGVAIESIPQLGDAWAPIDGTLREIGGRRVLEVEVDVNTGARFFRLRTAGAP